MPRNLQIDRRRRQRKSLSPRVANHEPTQLERLSELGANKQEREDDHDGDNDDSEDKESVIGDTNDSPKKRRARAQREKEESSSEEDESDKFQSPQNDGNDDDDYSSESSVLEDVSNKQFQNERVVKATKQQEENDGDQQNDSNDGDEDFQLSDDESEPDDEASDDAEELEDQKPRRQGRAKNPMGKANRIAKKKKEEEEYDSEDDDTDNDNDSEFEDEKEPRPQSGSGKKRITKLKKKQNRQVANKEDSSDDGDTNVGNQKRHAVAIGNRKKQAQKSAPNGRSQRQKVIHKEQKSGSRVSPRNKHRKVYTDRGSSEEDEAKNRHDEQKAVGAASPSGIGKKRATSGSSENHSARKSPRATTKKIYHDRGSSEEEGETVESRSQKSGRRKVAKSARVSKSSSDDSEYDSPPISKIKPKVSREPKNQHKSPRKSKAKRVLNESDSESDRNFAAADEVSKPPARTRQKCPSSRKSQNAVNKVYNEEDDDYNPEEESWASEDSSEGNDSDASDDSLMKRTKTGFVDNEDFLDADLDSDTEPQKPPRVASKPSRPPKGDSDGDESEVFAEPHLSAPHMPHCPSTVDAITMDQLPERHICFVPSQGQARQCFALETLHKIAMSGTHLYDEQGKITFKQPPHFRTKMSDDLLDQVASRFGRPALDLKGYFYNKAKRGTMPNAAERDTDDYIPEFEGNLADDDAFREHLQRYLSKCMGSRDLYCCPVCYTEAYRRLEHQETPDDIEDDEPDDEETQPPNVEFAFDPMTVLGYIDNSDYKLASGFCFSKLAQVKQHLREDHSIQPKGLEGNDLFKRFQIRASDGLLQRWLEKTHRSKNQGNMMSYWFEGNNELFVHNLHLVERCHLIREKVRNPENGEDIEDALDFVEDLQTFWDSFRIRARRIWDWVAEPFMKVDEKEIENFMVDDDEDVGGDAIHHREVDAATRPTPEDEIVMALRQKRGVQSPDDNDEEDDSSEEEEEEETGIGKDLADSDYEGHYGAMYSSSSSEDEWMASKYQKRRKNLKKRTKPNTRPKTKTTALQVKRLGKRRKTRSSPSSAASTPSITTTEPATQQNKKRRRIIDDLDSD